MKTILIVALLFLAMSTPVELLGMGENCDTSSPFICSNFIVSPYPPTSGVQISISMSGIFGKDIHVSDIASRVRYNGGSWTTSYSEVNQTFAYGQSYTFAFTNTAGKVSGYYETQIKLESKQGNPFSCWYYTYHIA
ncbi:hypothetical protein SteCoe_16601 [Stentor coeruleus]|uniref:Uncharacterized protein n=1 Tax=Stentor coeruleus TaxID=5963 RepID=A0A1R2C0S5_9CILI|nr:hypothetical protein SteCoe_16601 [Stentor coeruleus]